MQKYIYAILIAMIPVALFFAPYETPRDVRYFEDCNGLCGEGCECGWEYGREFEMASILDHSDRMSLNIPQFVVLSALVGIPIYYFFFKDDEYTQLRKLKDKWGEE